jgi:O-ureido-D-serine cyclo-ligase
VDLVRLGDGQPALIELELIEPSLYFPYDQESPQRFARALNRLDFRR